MDQIMNTQVALSSPSSLQKFNFVQRCNENKLNANHEEMQNGAIVRHFSQWYADSANVKRESECQSKQGKRVFTS